MPSPTSGLGPSSSKSKKAIDGANAATEKWKKNILDIESSVKRTLEMWTKMNNGTGGTKGGSASKFNSDLDGSIRSAQAHLDKMIDRPMTGMEKAGAIGRFGLGVAAFGYGMMPNTMDAVQQRVQAQGVASMTGMNAEGLIKSSNAALGAGFTSASSATGATTMFASGGILPTMGSYKNLMGQVGGYSMLTGQSNEQVASGLASINGMNFMRMGIRARDSKGNLRSGSDLGNDLYRRMGYNKSTTVENVAQVYNTNSKAYQSVMSAAGGNKELFNTLASNLVFQAKNKGEKLDMSEAGVNKIMDRPADDPMRKWYTYQKSEAAKLEVTGKGLVGGYGMALDATTAVNNGFTELAKKMPDIVKGIGNLKGALDTLPQAGNTGASLSGFGSEIANDLIKKTKTKLEEKAIDAVMGQFGLGGKGGGGGGGAGGSGGGSNTMIMGKQGLQRLSSFGKSAAGRAGLGALAIGVGSYAVPKLRDFGRNSLGVKKGSGGERAGTMLGYAGTYAAGGALMGSMFGPAGTIAGAVIGTGIGLYKGYSESNKHAQDPNTGGDAEENVLAAAIRTAGFGPKSSPIAFAVAMAESGGGNAKAHNTNRSTGDNSYGLFQINMIDSLGVNRRKQYHLKNNNQLFNPVLNAKIAYQISNKGRDWSAWTTYTQGTYKQHLGKAASMFGTSSNSSASGGENKRSVTGEKVHQQHGGVGGGIASPSDGPITATYGQKPKDNTYWQMKGYHTGTDYGVKKGSPVKSYRSGVVSYVGSGKGYSGAGEAYGNIVVVDHGGHESMYAHLERGTVKKGQKVTAGQQIALSGQSGSGAKAGPHLHFEIRKGNFSAINTQDPKGYLAGLVGGSSSGSVGNTESSGKSIFQKFGNILGNLFKRGTDDSDSSDKNNQFSHAAGSIRDTLGGSVTRSGFVGNKDTSTNSLFAFGGDVGMMPTPNIGSNTGGGVVINMNVVVHGTSTNDARKFANDVKSILEKDLRNAKIGSY